MVECSSASQVPSLTCAQFEPTLDTEELSNVEVDLQVERLRIEETTTKGQKTQGQLTMQRSFVFAPGQKQEKNKGSTAPARQTLVRRIKIVEAENEQLKAKVGQLVEEKNTKDTIGEEGRENLKSLMQTAFEKHDTTIQALRKDEAILQTEQAQLLKQKSKLTEKEAKLKKMQVLCEGTSHKLRIRKEELDKEWERVDILRSETTKREANLEKERVALTLERELFNAEKQEKIHLQQELKDQMADMENLTTEIERKENWLSQEAERVELLASKLARKEKSLALEQQRVANLESELSQSRENVVRQQEFITVERESIAEERQKMTDTRSLSSMYIPDLKQVLKKTRINTTMSTESCKRNTNNSVNHSVKGSLTAQKQDQSGGGASRRQLSAAKLPPSIRVRPSSRFDTGKNTASQDQLNKYEAQFNTLAGEGVHEGGTQTNMSVFMRKCGSQENCGDLSSNCQVHATNLPLKGMRNFHKTCKNLLVKEAEQSTTRSSARLRNPQLSKVRLRSPNSSQTMHSPPSHPGLAQSSWMKNAGNLSGKLTALQSGQKEDPTTIETAPLQLESQQQTLNSLIDGNTARFDRGNNLHDSESANSLLDYRASTAFEDGAAEEGQNSLVSDPEQRQPSRTYLPFQQQH